MVKFLKTPSERFPSNRWMIRGGLVEFYQRLVFISKNFYENLYRGFPNEGCRIMKTGNKGWKYLLVNDILIHCMRLG